MSICYAICLFFLFRGIIYYANGLSPLHLLLIGESNADSNQLDNSGGVPNGNCGGSGPFGNENNNVAFSSSCNQEKKEQPESDLGCNFIVCKNEIQVCAITDRSSGSVIRKTIDLSGVPEKALQQIHEAFICCSDLDHQFLSKSVNNYFDILSSILEEYFNNPYLTKKQKQYIFDLKVALYDGKFSIFRESPLLFSRSPICTESFAYGFRALISHRLEDVVQSGRAYLVDETVLRYSGLPGHWYYGSTVSHEGDFVKSCAYATSSKWKGNIDLKVPLNINGHVLDLAKGESQNMTPFFCTKFCKSSGMLHLFDGDAYLFLKNKQNKMALTAAVASLGFLCGEKICYCKNLLNNLDAD